jgi:uncharacterized DUF497 family protein
LVEFEWDPKKSELLKRKRGISFDELAELITSESLLAVREHPNPRRYPEQKIFIVDVGGYAWVVPFEKRGNKLRLITAYPSRKWTKVYLRGKGGEEKG